MRAVDEGMAETFPKLHEDVVQVATLGCFDGGMTLTKNCPNQFRILRQNRFVKLLLNDAHCHGQNDLCHWWKEFQDLKLGSAQKEWSNEIMQLRQILLRQLFVLQIQFSSLYGCIEELEKVEQLSLVVLERRTCKRISGKRLHEAG